MSNEKEKDLNLNQEPEEAAVPAGEPEEAPESETGPTPLEALQKECDALNDRYLRLMAEYDNFRKRTSREKTELFGNATASAVERFLPILDNFERATGFDPDSEDFKKGVELIFQNFQSVLEGLGVEAFGNIGETFDPAMHHAVSHIEDDSLGENVISQVMQKGYKMGERIIRYAMVQTAN